MHLTRPIPHSDIDTNEMTANNNAGLIFLTNKFKDGTYIGFWSTSPCGCIHNQDRGWAVVSSSGELLDSIHTYDHGPVVRYSDETFAEWRKRQTMEHGRSTRISEWKMEE